MDHIQIKYYQNILSKLPKGNITYKKINGKSYPYLQWNELGKQRSRIIKESELVELEEKINYRKKIELQIKQLETLVESNYILREDFYFTEIKTKERLSSFVLPVKDYQKRECYQELHNYIYGNSTDRVFILYGLRRTGKTTLIRQLILNMSEEMFSKTAFIQIRKQTTLDQINIDLRRLVKEGYQYLFIDEVTLMDDFIESASLFSDIYASSGLKIVLSGTDSLSFLFAEDQELYDRAYMLHTTLIHFREFEQVLGIKGIDEFINYGGTMSLGGVDYHDNQMTFLNEEKTSDYVDSAIARNIQHSLKNYQNGNHFRSLIDLYEANELTSAINRVVEDINHRFTISVLTKDFVSNDLSLTAKNLIKDKNNATDILYQIDLEQVTDRLKEMLEIKNMSERNVKITDEHRIEIKEYLKMLDLIVDIDVVYMSNINKRSQITAISQPGMRYHQARALIEALLKDELFNNISITEKKIVFERILNDVRGRIMEEIVLLETKMAYPKCEIFKLVFATGEFDMVVFDPELLSCKIYEIKHTANQTKEQYRHLIDEEKERLTEFNFGKIEEKVVLYRGSSMKMPNGVSYLNVEEYLLNL